MTDICSCKALYAYHGKGGEKVSDARGMRPPVSGDMRECFACLYNLMSVVLHPKFHSKTSVLSFAKSLRCLLKIYKRYKILNTAAAQAGRVQLKTYLLCSSHYSSSRVT